MTEISTQPEVAESDSEESLSNGAKAGIIIGVIVLIAAIVGVIVFLLGYEKTYVIRDIFIIFLGFEFVLIGVATVLLIIQTARLINMFQHEIKPVLDAANETMGTIRGTAVFLGDAMVEPVIKFNSYFASLKKFLELINIKSTKSKKE